MWSARRDQGWHAHPCTGRVHVFGTIVMGWWVVVMGVAGCTSSLPPLPPPAAPPSVPESMQPAGPSTNAEYTLGPGDVLRITIYGQGDLPQRLCSRQMAPLRTPLLGT